MQITKTSQTNLALGDPERLEAGEEVTLHLVVFDRFGNIATHVKQNGSFITSGFTADISISGSGLSNGTNTPTLTLPLGQVQFPVTDVPILLISKDELNFADPVGK